MCMRVYRARQNIFARGVYDLSAVTVERLSYLRDFTAAGGDIRVEYFGSCYNRSVLYNKIHLIHRLCYVLRLLEISGKQRE